MLNPFFLQGSKNEQHLVQDLINEQLKIYGVDVYYLPRQYITEKTVIKEVIQSEFNSAYPIEAYVETYDGYGGQGTILSKFGIQEMDELVLTISRERFENYISPLIKEIPNIKLSTRPKEGDLIWFPLGDRIFEIKYVEHEKPFYQLQGNYTYELRCELFRYGEEVIDTGIYEIDNNTQDLGYIQTLTMVGVGSTASAITNIVNGGIKSIIITNRGSGYETAPIVAFSSAPYGGITATGIASMIGGIVDICEPNPDLLRVQSVELTNPGMGYTVAPRISFRGGGGSGAAATCIISNGIVGIITITNGGSGYVNEPSVTFIGTASSTAIGKAIIQNGSVSEIRILNSGEGYIGIPTIIIGNPVLIGSGSYEYNEVIVGTISSTRAKVKSWNSSSKLLEISNITGKFVQGETLIGQKSGAEYVIRTINGDRNKSQMEFTQDSIALTPEKTIGEFGQNAQIQLDANEILDFSEKNPFGTP